MQLTKKEVVEQIKIIREALEWIGENTHFWQKPFPIAKTKELLRFEEALTALAQLEIGMQSVSERYIDIPIEQPTVNELSQVKPSIEEIRNKAINEVADSYHGEMANYFCKKANNEKLAGVKEDYFALADKHREYQNDIKNQVWLYNLKP